MKKTFSFVDIVSKIWTLCNANAISIANPIHLHKLQICWISHCDPLYVDIWVWATILCGMQELSISPYLLTINPLKNNPNTGTCYKFKILFQISYTSIHRMTEITAHYQPSVVH